MIALFIVMIVEMRLAVFSHLAKFRPASRNPQD